jgi:putative DNA primase/helicase
MDDNVFGFPPGGKGTPDVEENPDDRVAIRISSDNIAETVTEVEDSVRALRLPLYRRGSLIVRAGLVSEKLPDGSAQVSLLSPHLSPAGLGDELSKAVAFAKYDGRAKKYVSCHATKLLLESILARGSFSNLLPLNGLTDIPLIRSDGTLLDKPGHDEQSGVLFLPSGIVIKIPRNPTLDDAKNAVAILSKLVREFPFVTETDRAVAISALISACCRPTIGPTPLHAFSAPTPRTGKGLYVSIVAIVATGCEPGRFVLTKHDEDELEKRLNTQLLKGQRIISIDNITKALGGDAICTTLTEKTQAIRILGQSRDVDIANTAFLMANGNNLCLEDDLNPRSVLCRMDSGKEHPEERQFRFNARALAHRARGVLVSACLTIVLAHHAAGSPRKTIPLGGFEGWSRRVRDALIWAGMPDPCGNKAALRDNDPKKDQFLVIARLMEENMAGICKAAKYPEFKASEVTAFAESQGGEFKSTLMAVAGIGPIVDPGRLGTYFNKYENRPIGGYKMTKDKGNSNVTWWKLSHDENSDGQET